MSGTDIIPFAFGDNLVRVHRDESGNPWWVAADVARILDIQNIRQNLADLDSDEKGVCTIYTLGGTQEVSTINEPGLYSLVFRSRKPEAREFKRWVTHEVLPSIRKTGAYARPAAPAPETPALDFGDLPADVRLLRPRARERCMHLALQSARLSGLSSLEEQRELFIEFCRLLGGPGERDVIGQREVRLYAETRLVDRPGSRLQADHVYRHFARWWAAAFPGQSPPSRNVVGQALGARLRRIKSNSWFYLDVAFAPAA